MSPDTETWEVFEVLSSLVSSSAPLKVVQFHHLIAQKVEKVVVKTIIVCEHLPESTLLTVLKQ